MIESQHRTRVPDVTPPVSVALMAAALGFAALVGAAYAGLQSLIGG